MVASGVMELDLQQQHDIRSCLSPSFHPTNVVCFGLISRRSVAMSTLLAIRDARR